MTSFIAALKSLPRPGAGNGYHQNLLSVAIKGIRAGVSPLDICSALRDFTPAGTRNVPNSEIVAAVDKATRDFGAHKTATSFHWHKPQGTVKHSDISALKDRLLAEGEGKSEGDIWEASPVRIDWAPEQDTVELLTRIYNPDDFLFIGDRCDKQVKSVSQWLSDFRSGRPIPPYVIPNPLTGLEGLTKDGKASFRADDCVESFRFAVAEFDSMPREDQLKFWWSVNMPVCALIDSGGKSIHGWVKVDGITTADEWTQAVEREFFGEYLIPLGCDGACKNEARLSRMAGHFRGEKHNWQRLLYLCPTGRRVNVCKR